MLDIRKSEVLEFTKKVPEDERYSWIAQMKDGSYKFEEESAISEVLNNPELDSFGIITKGTTPIIQFNNEGTFLLDLETSISLKLHDTYNNMDIRISENKDLVYNNLIMYRRVEQNVVGSCHESYVVEYGMGYKVNVAPEIFVKAYLQFDLQGASLEVVVSTGNRPFNGTIIVEIPSIDQNLEFSINMMDNKSRRLSLKLSGGAE